jgi:hypothetical protein
VKYWNVPKQVLDALRLLNSSSIPFGLLLTVPGIIRLCSGKGRQNVQRNILPSFAPRDQIISLQAQQHQFTMSRSTNVNILDRPLERDISISTTRVRWVVALCSLIHSVLHYSLAHFLLLFRINIARRFSSSGDQLCLYLPLVFLYSKWSVPSKSSR